KTSSLSVPLAAGQTNFVVVDGVTDASGVAAYGILHFNYSLVPVTLNALSLVNGAAHLQVNGQANMPIAIERSTDLRTWTTVLTTTMAGAAYDFVDAASTSLAQRFYRVRLLP